MNQIRINLCGRTRVITADGVELEHFGGTKPRQVLEMLALAVGRPLSKDHLAEQLWDGATPPSYVGTLESYICVLRRLLGSKGRDSAIQTTTTGYMLRRDKAVVDVEMARRMLRKARTATGPEAATTAARMVDTAVALLDGGELLASEPHAAWAQAQRTAHATALVDLLGDVAQHALTLQAPPLAARLARAATDRDPLAERAWQIQLRALIAQDRLPEALACYATLRETLLTELGTEPTLATRTLYNQLLAHLHHQQDTNPHTELTLLIRLLRQALEAVPGIRLPDEDDHLTAVAVRVLRSAA